MNTTLTPSPTSTPVPFKKFPLYAFFSANAISSVGSTLTAIAIPWFVLQTTGSYIQMGVTAFAATLPSIISTFFSNLVIDRLGYKRTSVLGDIMSGISVLLIPLLHATIGLAFWQLLLLVFMGGLLKAPGGVARESMVPDLAELAHIPLERTNAATDGIGRIAGFIGAPLAAILIVLIGSGNLLWLDASSFFLSALLIGSTLYATPPLVKTAEHTTIAGSLTEGFRFLSKHHVLLALITTVMVTNLLDAAHSAVLMPAYAQQIYKSAIPLGVLWTVFGGAAFAGTVLFGAIGHRLPKRLTFGLCFVLLGLRFWLLLFQLPLSIVIAGHVLSGLAAGPLNPIIFTIQQRLIPAEMRARIFSIIGAGYMAGIPLGGLLGGLILNWLGLLPGLAILASCYLLATSSLLINPKLKQLDQPVKTNKQS